MGDKEGTGKKNRAGRLLTLTAMGTPFPSRPRLFSPSQQTPEELRRLEGVWRHTRQAQTRVPSFASSTQSAKPPPLYSDTRAPSTQVNSHSPTPIPIPTPTAPCHPSAWNPLATDHLPPKEQALKHGFVRIIHHSVELSLRDELWVLSGDGSRVRLSSPFPLNKIC